MVTVACGDDAGTPTTAAATTTAATSTTDGVVSTTTTLGTDTTVPKPDDTRVDGLALAGGFSVGGTPVTVPPDPTTVDEYTDYVTVTDDSGVLSVNLPVEWVDVNGEPWTDNIFGLDGTVEGGIGVALSASPDYEGWSNTWTVPGLFFGASDQIGGSVDDVLDAYGYVAEECTYDGRYDYDDGVYAGKYDWWNDCGGVGTVFVIIAARPAGGEFTALVEITMVTEADLAVADEIVASYYVTVPELTGDGGALDASLDANYGAFELLTGFAPDPQGLEVSAGGDVDVSAYLGSECAGFVTAAPDLEITWTGGGGGLRFYFVAATAGDDTVLVINDPNGEWWCGDDSYEGFNPTIDFTTAPDGVYDIWVGSYGADTLIPGTFFVTEVDANHP
ncbi:MAG: hypothetical protein HZA58_08780 [Acidimicrobiia bacterium]|nr:hypothetical protein [Acidimicrobiia bacterium]